MNMMKALIPSTILTLILSAFVGPSGIHGSYLNFQSAVIGGYTFYWSWTFFFLAMGFNGCLLMLRSTAGDSAEQN